MPGRKWADYMNINNVDIRAYMSSGSKYDGLSVRCVKD